LLPQHAVDLLLEQPKAELTQTKVGAHADHDHQTAMKAAAALGRSLAIGPSSRLGLARLAWLMRIATS
jgi:hypothetical protein